MSPSDRHNVRRVVLPSGKTIEVVYFDDLPARSGAAPEAPAAPPARPISVCDECGSDLVYPLDWQEADDHHWEMTLRCPECQTVRSGIYDYGSVEAFEEELDRGTEQLVSDLRSLSQANMEEDVERFAMALAFDAVLPEDF
jgi:hypothetical protein